MLRRVLILTLAFIGMLLWQSWQTDYGPKPAAITDSTQNTGANPSQTTSPTGSPSVSTPTDGANIAAGERIDVKTDVYKLQIAMVGGGIEQAQLLKYPVNRLKPDEPYTLLDNSQNLVFITQGGFLSDAEAPNQHTTFQSEQHSYELADGQDTLEVKLSWKSSQGVTVNKIYTFHRGSYVIDKRLEVVNNSTNPWHGRPYSQLQRSQPGASNEYIQSYTGAVVSSPEKRYDKVKFTNMQSEPLDRDITDGWAAMIQHYFLAAILPESGAQYHYYTKTPPGDKYVIGFYGPDLDVAPGSTKTSDMRLYIGPKDQANLYNIAPGLELTADYGRLWFIAKPLFWLLDKFHSLVNNWGWAIIMVTLVVKLAFFHLSAVSFKSMAKMRKIQPQLTAIRERYGNDRAKVGQATMELYKREKINPMSGCLPILVQIPVFIALYWVLSESVELRQANFVLWLNDLSAPDPYYILPMLYAVSMFIQQRLSPPAADPMQQKIFQWMPVMFSITFAFFPSGLVLYWVVGNIWSIIQQWIINRRYGHLATPVAAT